MKTVLMNIQDEFKVLCTLVPKDEKLKFDDRNVRYEEKRGSYCGRHGSRSWSTRT